MSTDRKPTCIACAGAGGGISEEEVKSLIDTSEAELLDLGWELVSLPSTGKKNAIVNDLSEYDYLIRYSDNACAIFTKELAYEYSNAIYSRLVVSMGGNTYGGYDSMGVGNSKFRLAYARFYHTTSSVSLKMYDLSGTEIQSTDISTYLQRNSEDKFTCLKPFIFNITGGNVYGNVNASTIMMPGDMPSIIELYGSSMQKYYSDMDRTDYYNIRLESVYTNIGVTNVNVNSLWLQPPTDKESNNTAWFTVYKRKRLIPYKVISQ